MIKILIATHNRAKLERYRYILDGFSDIQLVSLSDNGITEKASEPFNSAMENAVHKAKFYGDLSGYITIAVDEAVHTNFLPDDEQPGVNVRRFKNGKNENTDEGVLCHWREVFDKYTTVDKKFIWDFSIAYYNPATGASGSTQIEWINGVAKVFAKKYVPGYPMSSFVTAEGDDRPWAELSEEEKRESAKKSFIKFVEDFNNWLK